MSEDWTRWLTEKERRNIERARLAGCNHHGDAHRSLAASRALVAEKDKALVLALRAAESNQPALIQHLIIDALALTESEMLG